MTAPWPPRPVFTDFMTPPEFPPSSADSDLALVERTNAGDMRAFELLVIKYQRRIERLIGRMVRDVDLVPDIAQETFIRAYRALHQFRGDAQFYTWLYRIAVNTAKKALLDMKRSPLITESADRKSTRLNSSHLVISYAVFCLKKKNNKLDRFMECVSSSYEAYVDKCHIV